MDDEPDHLSCPQNSRALSDMLLESNTSSTCAAVSLSESEVSVAFGGYQKWKWKHHGAWGCCCYKQYDNEKDYTSSHLGVHFHSCNFQMRGYVLLQS